VFYLGGNQGGKSKNPVNTAVVTPSASGRSSAKFPSIRENPKGKIAFGELFEEQSPR
jgi:hypothetical protein